MIESCFAVVDVGLDDIIVLVQDGIEESTDVDFFEAFVRVAELRVIHEFDGFGHLFYADALAVLLVTPVPLIFYCFGTHVFSVGCTHIGVNFEVRGWLLIRRIV